MQRTAIAAAIIMLTLPAGMCATTRYVPVHCLTPEQYKKLQDDEPPKVKQNLTGKADEDLLPVAGSAVRLRAWGNGMLGVLGGCVG